MSCIAMHVKQLKLKQFCSQAAIKTCSRHSLAEMLNPEQIRQSREEPVHLPADTTTDLTVQMIMAPIHSSENPCRYSK